MRAQSPSRLALVPCALSMADLSANYDVESHKHPGYIIIYIIYIIYILAPYARTSRYEEAFSSLENQGKKWLASLARLIITNILYDTHRAQSGRVVSALLSMSWQCLCFRLCHDKMLVSKYSLCYPFTGSTPARDRECSEHFCANPDVT